MNDLKLNKLPGIVSSALRTLFKEAKQLKKDARDEGINMFVELKGDMIDIKKIVTHRHKVDILQINPDSGFESKEASMATVDLFYTKENQKFVEKVPCEESQGNYLPLDLIDF